MPTYPPAPSEFEAALKLAIDSKTKPIGSLGRIESLAAQLARIQGSLEPKAETCSLTIFAADHGMATAGVSAFPQDVTRAMVHNFLSDGAASTVFARALDVQVQVVDGGICGDPIDHAALLNRRIGPGTQNAIKRAAMTAEQYDTAKEFGRTIGAALESDVACFGEMGIGNTSSASLIAAKILGVPVAQLVDRGTGLDTDGLARKHELLQTAAARTSDQLSPDIALQEYGGFEIVMMAGAMVAASQARKIVLVDGFISSAAALAARALEPGCDSAFVFAHQSAESGHTIILKAMDADPLLSFDMRLGEGTGAVLAWPIVKAAAAMLREMATFESAGVSEAIDDNPK